MGTAEVSQGPIYRCTWLLKYSAWEPSSCWSLPQAVPWHLFCARHRHGCGDTAVSKTVLVLALWVFTAHLYPHSLCGSNLAKLLSFGSLGMAGEVMMVAVVVRAVRRVVMVLVMM